MPIFFDFDNEQVQVDFGTGDLIAGMCGDEGEVPECVGITESPVSGKEGDFVPDEIDAGYPAVVLSFNSRESLDVLIELLQDFRTKKFGEGRGING